MNIINKNEGAKVAYEVNETTISFRDGELSLNLASYERDFPVKLDVCSNEYGMLTLGVDRRYVAQIDIPAREYDVTVDGEETIRTLIALNMDNVTLTLWEV